MIVIKLSEINSISFSANLSNADLDNYNSQLPVNCCEKCRFWNVTEGPLVCDEMTPVIQDLRNDSELYAILHTGNCRRRSPVVAMPAIVGLSCDTPIWPETVSDDYCGDFETKVITQDAASTNTDDEFEKRVLSSLEGFEELKIRGRKTLFRLRVFTVADLRKLTLLDLHNAYVCGVTTYDRIVKFAEQNGITIVKNG